MGYVAVGQALVLERPRLPPSTYMEASKHADAPLHTWRVPEPYNILVEGRFYIIKVYACSETI